MGDVFESTFFGVLPVTYSGHSKASVATFLAGNGVALSRADHLAILQATTALLPLAATSFCAALRFFGGMMRCAGASEGLLALIGVDFCERSGKIITGLSLKE
jgi:ABC-type nickel/cobalt efflux system permease component RcnA